MLDDNGTFRRGLKLCEDEQGIEEDGLEVEVELEEELGVDETESGVDETEIKPILNYVRQETAALLNCLKWGDDHLRSLAERFGYLAYGIVAAERWETLVSDKSLEKFGKAMDNLCGQQGLWRQIHFGGDQEKIGAIRNMPEIIRHIARIHWAVTYVRNKVDEDLTKAFSDIRMVEINLLEMDYKFLAPQEAANDFSKPKEFNLFQEYKLRPIVKTFPIRRAYEAEAPAPKDNLIKIDFAFGRSKVGQNKISNKQSKSPILFRNLLQSPVKKGFRAKRFNFSRIQEDKVEP